MAGNPNFAAVSLQLHSDGSNTSTTFADTSPRPKTVTANGNAQISTAQSKWGGSSAKFDGTGDYLSVPAHTDFVFGTGDLTVEAWVYIAANSALSTGLRSATVVSYGSQSGGNTNYWTLQVDGSSATTGTGLSFNVFNSAVSGVDKYASAVVSVSQSAWHHVAVTRAGSTWRMFLDGALQTLSTDTIGAMAIIGMGTNGLLVGRFAATGYLNELNGYVDDLRITKGVAVYTAAFTPPAAAFEDSGPQEARLSAAGPLGVPQLLAALPVGALLAVAGPLGVPAVVATLPLTARLAVPALLGAPAMRANHDFTALLGDVISVYVMDLITPTGTVRVPISSWQATLQTGASNYVQCVVPACAVWAAAINAATEFAISRRAVLPGGQAIEVEMARAPADTAIFDQGPSRYTCTLSGYSTAFGANPDPAAAYDRTLTGVRSVSSGTTRRVRCAVDWLLRPGQRAWVQGLPLVVGYINYYAPSGFDAYMDVGEQR